MALVGYSDSDSDSEPKPPKRPSKAALSGTVAKRRRRDDEDSGVLATPSLPPIPNELLDLYTSNSRVSVRDDPSLHNGRKRAIPHVEGNWPTHVYLEWYPNNQEIKSLSEVISKSKAKLEKGSEVKSFLYSDLGAQLPLHISLSRPVVLLTEQRHSFSDLVQDAIRESDIRPFEVTISGLDWVSNYENTRWFLVLRVTEPENNGLNQLLRISNQSLSAFDQPPLYGVSNHTPGRDKPRTRGRGRGRGGPDREPVASQSEDCSECFHISIAWSLTKPSDEENERLAEIGLGSLRDLKIHFDNVKTKIGNNVRKLKLSTKTLETRGFGGL